MPGRARPALSQLGWSPLRTHQTFHPHHDGAPPGSAPGPAREPESARVEPPQAPQSYTTKGPAQRPRITTQRPLHQRKKMPIQSPEGPRHHDENTKNSLPLFTLTAPAGQHQVLFDYRLHEPSSYVCGSPCHVVSPWWGARMTPNRHPPRLFVWVFQEPKPAPL